MSMTLKLLHKYPDKAKYESDMMNGYTQVLERIKSNTATPSATASSNSSTSGTLMIMED